jgi:hypothetical protein
VKLRALLHKHTTCRIGVHSPWGDWEYDGSRASLVCRHCRKIVGHGYIFDVGNGVAYGCYPRGEQAATSGLRFVSFVVHKETDRGSDAKNR